MNSMTSDNYVYAQQSAGEGVIKLRLDNSSILQGFKLFLTGKELVNIEDDNGMIKTVLNPIGVPLVNEKGVQALLGLMSNIINSQSVQGNWKSERYEDYVYESDVDVITKNVFTNRLIWDIKEESYMDLICDAFISLVQPFISRTIDNKERESYNSMQSRETTVQNEGRRGMFTG